MMTHDIRSETDSVNTNAGEARRFERLRDWHARPLRTHDEEREVNDLLRQLDRTVARLFELRVNPYFRCTCVWSEPHAETCALWWRHE